MRKNAFAKSRPLAPVCRDPCAERGREVYRERSEACAGQGAAGGGARLYGIRRHAPGHMCDDQVMSGD